MRNYVKLNFAVVQIFYNSGANFLTLYTVYDDPDEVWERVAEYKSTIVLSYSGGDYVFATFTKYFKMNKAEIITALNRGGYQFSSTCADLYDIELGTSINGERRDRYLDIFVDKSPRKSEKRRQHG